MHLVVLAEAGPTRDAWSQALASVELDPPTFVDSWAALMKEVIRARPTAIVLAHRVLVRDNDAALAAADMTLRALGIAAIVALEEDELDRRHAIELQTDFEHFAVEPYRSRALLATLRMAILSAGAEVPDELHAADPSSDTGPGRPSPSHADGEDDEAPTTSRAGGPWRRARTPLATPAVGFDVVPQDAERPDSDSSDSEDAFAHERDTATHRTPVELDPGVAETQAQPPLKGLADAVDAEDPLSAAAFFGVGDGQRREADDRVTTQVPVVLEDIARAMSTADPADASEDAEDARRRPAYRDEDRYDDTLAEATDTEPIDTDKVFEALTGTPAPRAHDASGARPAAEPHASPRGSASVSGEHILDHLSSSGGSSRHAPTAAASGSYRAASDSGAQPAVDEPVVSLTLPDPNSGNLADVSVPQLLFTLCAARATGELVLQTSSLSRSIAFLEGEPGTVFQVPQPDDEKKLLSTFGWTSGTYAFEAKRVPEAQFYTFGEPHELIFRGVQRNLGLNETATALGGYLKKYPVATNQVSRFRRVLGLEGLAEFAERADGSRTLEELMVVAGADTERFLHLAYFAWMSGCVVFTDAPTPGPIPVQFEAPEIRAGTGSTVARPANVTLSASGIGDRQIDQLSGATRRISAGASAPRTGDEDAQRETFEKLSRKWEVVASRGPYEVFELEPGCGVDAVNTRFYELVRQYHPDRYARAHNQQIRGLAEKIFVQIRNVHTELTELERDGGGAAATISGQGLSDSGVSRRRRAAAVRSAPQFRTTPSSPPDVVAERRAVSTNNEGIPASQSQRVGDVLNRLRTRGRDNDSGGHPAPLIKQPPPGSGPSPSLTGVRRLAPDQLIRNAKEATERGNFEKGLELITLAEARGATGPQVEAYRTFLLFTQQQLSADSAVEILDQLYRQEPERSVERGLVLTLAGHTCRLEELNQRAIDYYDKAVREWPDNESASRWLRHLRRRVAEDDKKKPFSSSFLNKLFTKSK